jgi:hypothetical protein
MKKPRATLLVIGSILPILVLGQQTRQQASSNGLVQVIVAKKTRNIVVELANDSGKFVAGSNSICVLFLDAQTHTPAEVQNVSVQFRQQVGKITEAPITAQLQQDSAGMHCGYVDLGQLYYLPSSYYVFVRFVSADDHPRRVRLFTSVR